jgi:tetratricopeptide (TPR) repeat protein
MDAEEQDPENPIVRKRRAVALLALGRFDEARSTLLRAREIAPKDAEVDRLLGWVLDLQGETHAALEFCESSLRKDSQSRDTHLQFASLAARLGRHHDAIGHAKSAADLFRHAGDERGTGEAYSTLGWSYYMLGDFAASLQASTEALKLNPGLTPVHFNLALALLQCGRAAEARKEYEEGVARLSQVSDLKVHAIDQLHEALEKNPQLNGAAEILGILEDKYANLSKELARSGDQLVA